MRRSYKFLLRPTARQQHRETAAKVTQLHAKLRRQRVDYHHQVALALVRTYDVIACEDLNTGRRVVPVNARNTSRTCPQPCGYVAAENRVSQADFVCQRCGYTANADVVGALNVLSRAGLVLSGAA